MTDLGNLRKEIETYINPEKAAFFPRFFKTGPGQYGEGDIFLGITVPHCRTVAKKFRDLSLRDVERLLASKYHEERLIGLLILTLQYPKADMVGRKTIFDFYLSQTIHINNWDLVDLSARDIVGRHVYDNPELLPTLDQLAESSLLWDKRIAIIATFYFIQKGDPTPTLAIAERLLTDSHDLIKKANGWMLREVGKKIDRSLLIEFLKNHYSDIPRTTLRYAIEHFSIEQRKKLLKGDFGIIL